MGVRVERERQELIGLINKNRQFPGFLVKKRIPVGGGCSDDVVIFFESLAPLQGSYPASALT
jgi:hypothetical protein